MQIKRVLVLGASGRIGAILRRVWPAGQGLWQARGGAARPGWVVGDPLADAASLVRAGQGCGAVLCLAGVVPGRAGAMADNVALGAAAVRIGADLGAPVLLASSAAVYGNRSGVLPESAPPAPITGYGRAKADMETRCAALGARLGVAVTSLRIGNIAGVDSILGGWQPGFRLDRFDDGRTPRRSYVGPLTLARVLGALSRAGALPGVVNIATPGVLEMGALLDAAGLDWTPRPAPDSAIPEVTLDVGLLQGLYPLPPGAGLPETMVAEWRTLTESAA